MLDASGIIYINDNRFLVAEDEIDVLRFFILNNEKMTFTAFDKTIDFGHQESDFESLAFEPESQNYFCIGSHGEDYSRKLLSFKMDTYKEHTIKEIPFDAQRLINEKVDIEGLSVVGSQLLIGYRKPERKKMAIAVLYNVKDDSQKILEFDLSGRTFRDIVRLDDDNYLILGGPRRGKDYDKYPSRIFWWNGNVDSPQIIQCKVNLDGYRAEGIAVKKTDDSSLDILIGTDESKTDSATKFRILLLSASNISNLINGKIMINELRVFL